VPSLPSGGGGLFSGCLGGFAVLPSAWPPGLPGCLVSLGRFCPFFAVFGGFLMALSSSVSVVASSPFAGGVPSSFSLKVGSAPVPSSAFRAALPSAVLLGSPVVSAASGGGASVSVPWSCPVSGLSGSVRCLDRGFAPGEAARFFAALEAAAFASASSGALFFLGGAPGGPRRDGRPPEVLSGFFCAVSPEPFGPVSPAAPAGAAPVVFGG
jgi:hypothetical protein